MKGASRTRPARIERNPAPRLEPKPRPQLRSKPHRDWVATLPCLRCGRRPPCDPAHIRAGGDGGGGLKPSDDRVVPLCQPGPHGEGCHRAQHRKGEITFWAEAMSEGVSDPVGVAQRLKRISGDTEAGYRAIVHARPGLKTAWLAA